MQPALHGVDIYMSAHSTAMGTGYNGAGAPEEGDARQDMGTFWAKPCIWRCNTSLGSFSTREQS